MEQSSSELFYKDCHDHEMITNMLHHRRFRGGHGNFSLLAANSLLRVVGLLRAASQQEVAEGRW